MERNGNGISADVTVDAFENFSKDACFSFFQTIWQLFWTFWHCRINTISMSYWHLFTSSWLRHVLF